MANSPKRQTRNRKSKVAVDQSQGPTLTFQWSRSVVNLPLLDETLSEKLPAIDTDQSRRKSYPPISSTYRKRSSISQSTISTRTCISLPQIINQTQTPTSTEEESSPRTNPISLSYSQLQYIPPPPSPIKRSKQPRNSISSVSTEKRDSLSMVNGRVCVIPTPRSESIKSKCSSPTKNDVMFEKYNLIQLTTPQLRSLSVSEQYIDEAKKLYFNSECRIFIPRSSLPKIF